MMRSWAVPRSLALAVALLAVVSAVTYAVPSARAAPHPLVTGIVLVTEAGFTGGTDLASVDATITATHGDTLYALGAEGFAHNAPIFNDSLSLTWTVNATLDIAGFSFVLGHANVTAATGPDTVTFTDSLSGSLTLTVWDVSGSAGRLAHVGTGSSGVGTVLGDSVEVDNASALLGIVDVATRATGGTNAPDSNLSYATHGSISASDGLGALWATPPNGTGLIPAEIGTNASTSQAAWAFSIDPASAPASLTAGIASFGPDPSEIGLATVVFNGTAAGGSAPYAFNWSFGDGSFVNDTGNSTGLDSTPHVYATAGVFPVVLTVWDSLGANSSAFGNATVDAALALAITTNVTSPCVVPTVNDTCLVDLNTSAAFGLGNLDIEFLLLNETGVVVDSSFGNSTSSATFNATFAENLSVGTYNAWLNGTDDAGANVSFHLVFVVSIPAPGGGGLISGGTFDLILIGAVLAVIAIACVGMAGSSRRRRGPR